MIYKKLVNNCWWNVQHVLGGLFGLLAYFAPVKKVIILLISMILLDLISGIWAAYKTKETITSQKMWHSVPKIVWACLAVLLAYGMEQELQLEWLGLTKVVGGIICGFEFWSILENAAHITDHPLFGFIKKLLKNKMERALEQKLEMDTE